MQRVRKLWWARRSQRVVVARARAPRDAAVQHRPEYLGSDNNIPSLWSISLDMDIARLTTSEKRTENNGKIHKNVGTVTVIYDTQQQHYTNSLIIVHK